LEHKVYVVDDDEAVRDSVRAVLESHLFEVEDFETGAAFLEHWGTDGAAGCLVLDINMPELDGFVILRRLGAPLPGLPVVMITGRADSTTEARVRAAGAASLVEKPFAGEQLVDAVRSAIAGTA
jgi:two-component system response regulator FixJ